MQSTKDWLISPPSVVRIELVCGCNLRCSFCAVGNNTEDYPRGQYKFMTMRTARRIMLQLSDWLGADRKIRLEIAVRGESSLHPKLAKIISLMRSTFPNGQILFTTNGIVYTKKDGYHRVKELFRAGLNIMVVDTYRPVRKKVRKAFKAMKKKGRYEFLEYGTVNFTPWVYHKPDIQYIILMEDLFTIVPILKGKFRRQKPRIYTQAGNPDLSRIEKETGIKVEPVTTAYSRMCHEPFRVMNIYWNGTVPICCNDFTSDDKCLTFGSLHKITLKNIWEGKRLMAARTLLYRKNRDFSPCNKCNMISTSFSLMLSKAVDYFPKRSNTELKNIMFFGTRHGV